MTTTLRPARGDDADQIAAIYAPYANSTAVSFAYRAPTAEEYRERIRTITARLPWLVCERDGIVAGYAYAGPHRVSPAYRWSVETSIYVHPEHQRTGVGRALYTALLEALRLLGYHRAYAGVTDPNPASVSLHEAVGFERFGTFEGVGYKLGGVAERHLARLPARQRRLSAHRSRDCFLTCSARRSGTPPSQPDRRCCASARASARSVEEELLRRVAAADDAEVGRVAHDRLDGAAVVLQPVLVREEAVLAQPPDPQPHVLIVVRGVRVVEAARLVTRVHDRLPESGVGVQHLALRHEHDVDREDAAVPVIE